MPFRSSAVKRLRNGNYQLRLSENERTVLGNLPAELKQMIEAGADDGSTVRLFPPGYSSDLGRQVEYDRLMRDDLMASHLGALHVLEETAKATEISESELHAWLRALNQLRLVFGTRLGVTDDTDEQEIDEDDPNAAAWSLYLYLGYLQDEVVEALSAAL